MLTVHHYQKRYYALQMLLMASVLFVNFNNYEFTSSVTRRAFYTTNTNSSNLLRFRDFEPRNYATMTSAASRTSNLIPNSISSDRKSRGLQFHADDKDVSIELEFIVPFVRVPIERSMTVAKSALRSLFNLNVSSILTTGAVIAVGGIFAIILKFLFTPFVPAYAAFRQTSRTSGEYNSTLWQENDNTDSNTQNIFSFIESKMHENNISVCFQKSICEFVQKSSSGNIEKVMDGVLSLDSIRNIISGTAVEQAVDAARSGEDCNGQFSNCNWNTKSLKRIFSMFTTLIKYLKVT
ncbi:uncharacterized protein LOC109612168 [Musca domestica]|uniref:Uncharacterized protein LOC109612168 n=1 Tax=Musca domestica TaxID=7370 RepID=A0ABM3VHS1_MUSDO|nr:uncharacterized protein LOC109612168 [Musca domestica]